MILSLAKLKEPGKTITSITWNLYDNNGVVLYGDGWIELYTIISGILRPSEIVLMNKRATFTAIAFDVLDDHSKIRQETPLNIYLGTATGHLYVIDYQKR